LAYDIFSTTGLLGDSITNSTWGWLGQGFTCNGYELTNQPASLAFYVLGTPVDQDGDGLTDAREWLSSKTAVADADSDDDELPDGWEVAQGLNPLVDDAQQSGARRNYSYDPVGRLKVVSGVSGAGFGYDKEGNVSQAGQ
jgi:hypothetical protein